MSDFQLMTVLAILGWFWFAVALGLGFWINNRWYLCCSEATDQHYDQIQKMIDEFYGTKSQPHK